MGSILGPEQKAPQPLTAGPWAGAPARAAGGADTAQVASQRRESQSGGPEGWNLKIHAGRSHSTKPGAAGATLCLHNCSAWKRGHSALGSHQADPRPTACAHSLHSSQARKDRVAPTSAPTAGHQEGVPYAAAENRGPAPSASWPPWRIPGWRGARRARCCGRSAFSPFIHSTAVSGTPTTWGLSQLSWPASSIPASCWKLGSEAQEIGGSYKEPAGGRPQVWSLVSSDECSRPYSKNVLATKKL